MGVVKTFSQQFSQSENTTSKCSLSEDLEFQLEGCNDTRKEGRIILRKERAFIVQLAPNGKIVL